MAEIAGLVFPLFGLILLGYLAARITKQPAEAMGWLNTFIIYVALPCLFFKLLSKTPIEKLTSWEFITTNISTTFVIFLMVYGIARLMTKATTPEATIQGLAGAYGNIGYMGPGIAILTFGEAAAVPLALIFCFENILHFIVAPTMMAISSDKKQHVARLMLEIAKKVFLHPFIIATIVGVAAAIVEFTPPLPIARLIDYLAQAAGALRPLRHGGDPRAPAVEARANGAHLYRALQSCGASGADVLEFKLVRRFRSDLGLHRRVARGAADGDECLCHRPAIWCLDRARLRHRPRHHLPLGRHRHRLTLRHDHRLDARRFICGVSDACSFFRLKLQFACS